MIAIWATNGRHAKNWGGGGNGTREEGGVSSLMGKGEYWELKSLAFLGEKKGVKKDICF